MSQWVEIKFDCLPLRSIPRLDIPVDASPKFAEKVARIKQAVEQHGTHNTYYVHNAKCTFHLTNDPSLGMVEFRFEGTVFTDESDVKAVRTIVDVQLEKENCGWLNQAIVDWLNESVRHALVVEFNRFIAAGDLKRTQERMDQIEQNLVQSGGFVGMYL
jgi:hypothetical protein